MTGEHASKSGHGESAIGSDEIVILLQVMQVMQVPVMPQILTVAMAVTM